MFLLEAGGLERLEELGGDGAGRFLDADFLAALAEIVVGDPERPSAAPGRPATGRGPAGPGSGRRPSHFRETSRRLLEGKTAPARRRPGGNGPVPHGAVLPKRRDGRGAGRAPAPRRGVVASHFFSSNSTSMTSSGLPAWPPLAEAAPAAAAPGPAAGAGRGAGGVEVLGHRLAGPLEVLDRPVDRGGVVALLGLVDLLDRRADGRLVGVGQLVLVLVHQLLELVDALIGGVAGLGQLALPLVLGGVRLGVALHPLDLVLASGRPRTRS